MNNSRFCSTYRHNDHHNRKLERKMFSKRTRELSQSTIAWKIMILTNGFLFFFLSFLAASLAVSVSLRTPKKSSLFSVFSALLFVPFDEAHIAPWRLLLASFLVVLLPPFGNSNGFFQLPKKKAQNTSKNGRTKIFSCLVELVHDCCRRQL